MNIERLVGPYPRFQISGTAEICNNVCKTFQYLETVTETETIFGGCTNRSEFRFSQNFLGMKYYYMVMIWHIDFILFAFPS